MKVSAPVCCQNCELMCVTISSPPLSVGAATTATFCTIGHIFSLPQMQTTKKQLQSPLPPCMGHAHFTFIVMDHVGPNQYSSHFDHSLSVSNVYCSGLEVFTTKVDWTFTLIQMNSIMCGSAEQETNSNPLTKT